MYTLDRYSTIVMINIIIVIILSVDEEMRSVKVKASPKIEFIASVLDHSNQLLMPGKEWYKNLKQ